MGTVDVNSNGPWFKASESKVVFGFSRTCGGLQGSTAVYDESPYTTTRSTWDSMVTERQISEVAVMAWLNTNWSAMHTWLDNLTSAERGRCLAVLKAWGD